MRIFSSKKGISRPTRNGTDLKVMDAKLDTKHEEIPQEKQTSRATQPTGRRKNIN